MVRICLANYEPTEVPKASGGQQPGYRLDVLQEPMGVSPLPTETPRLFACTSPSWHNVTPVDQPDVRDFPEMRTYHGTKMCKLMVKTCEITG